jgi:uncharacterized membrane protein required for colicin V production
MFLSLHTVSIIVKATVALQYCTVVANYVSSYGTASVRERIINLRVSMIPHFFLPSLQIQRPLLLLVRRIHYFCVDLLHEFSSIETTIMYTID